MVRYPRNAARVLSLSLVTLAGVLLPRLDAEPPASPEDRAKLIGKPAALDVSPAQVELVSPRDGVQVLVTARYDDGSMRDVTAACEVTCEKPDLVNLESGWVSPRQAGSGKLRIRAGQKEVTIPVVVRPLDQAEHPSFRREVIASLNVGGCNQGACHGSPSGKNGFRLSLRGSDPALDYNLLTRDALGRRADRQDPEESLIWQKGLGRVPHEGGARFPAASLPASILKGWIGDGLRDDRSDLPALTELEILPGYRAARAPARWQQLAVWARFADGSKRDVTRLTVFSSSDQGVASVSNNGLVDFGSSGEVAILCRYLDQMKTVRLSYLEPRPGFKWNNPPENNYIDTLVFTKLRRLEILPSDLCRDEEFLRRAYLDACGILPTIAETREFLDDANPNKRAALIEKLLARPEFSDFWTLKWADLLRSNRRAIAAKGVYVLQQWLHDKIARNVPFDQIVRELLTAKGSTFAEPAANYYRVARDPTSLAETTVQLFLGVRMQCAKCHNHPFERWTQDDYYSMAAFFARVRQRPERPDDKSPDNGGGKAEVVYLDRAGEVTHPRTNQPVTPRWLGGQAGDKAKLPADRREALADWLTRADNPFFARSVVNRLWYHLMGRGIVDPVDDFRDSNPAANDELLDALARDFATNGYDVRRILRTIMQSRTYQLSARTNEFNRDDSRSFSHSYTRLLTAEQLLDALCAATNVPEKYPGLPLGVRATQLPDGEMQHLFLKTFGQPARELACECERENDSSLTQALQLINGATINDKVRRAGNRVHKLLDAKTANPKVLEELYLATLSRRPTDGETQTALTYVGKASDRNKAWEDIQWALFNSREFLFRH